MPESSVKITLGVELDKSDLEQQIKEFQEEVKKYKLQMGLDVTPSDSSTGTTEDVPNDTSNSSATAPVAKINFDDLTNVVSSGVDSIKTVIEPLVGQITDLVDFVKQSISGIREDLQPIKDLAEIQKDNGKDLAKVTQDAIADIKNEVVGAIKDGVKEISDSTADTIKGAASQVSQDVREQLEKIISNQGSPLEKSQQEKPALIAGQEKTGSQIIELPSSPSGKDSQGQQDGFIPEDLINAIKDIFADIKDASQSLKTVAGNVSTALGDVVGIVEDALNPLKALTSSAKEILQELTSIAKSSLSDLKDLLVQTFSESLQAISDNVKSLLEQYLKDILNEVQTGLSDFLKSIINKKSTNKSEDEVVNAEIVVDTDDISNQIQEIINVLKSQEQKALPNADASNVRGAISSAASSTISILDSLYQLLSDRLTEIASRLLPSILGELQFDFLKSLVGGAVENLGATLSQQFSSGSANVLNKLLTGSLFKTPTPGKDTTLAFGEGFQSADPTNQGQIIQKLDVLISGIASQQPTFGSSLKAVNDSIGQSSDNTNQGGSVLDEFIDQVGRLINALNKNTRALIESKNALSDTSKAFREISGKQSSSSQNNQDDIIDVDFKDVTDQVLSGIDVDLNKLLSPGKDDDNNLSDEILQEILKANQDLIIINREGIQDRRTNIDQISGRSALDEVKRGDSGGGKERPKLANAQLENILGKTATLLKEIPGSLQELTNGLLKGAEIAGVNTGNIVNVLDIIGGLANLVDIVYKVNPELAASFGTLAKAIGQDAVDILIGAANGATEKIPELAKNFSSVEFEDKTINLAQQALNKVLPNNQVDIKQLINTAGANLNSLSQRGENRVKTTKENLQNIGENINNRFPITGQVVTGLTSTADKLTSQLNKLSGVLQEYLSQTQTSKAAQNLGDVVKNQVNNIISPDELQRAVPLSGKPDLNSSQTPPYPNIGQLDLDKFLPPELQIGSSDKQPDSLSGQIFPKIELPNLQDVLPDFNIDDQPSPKQDERQSVVTSMFNFVKNNLPQIVAGLILAKLATSLIAKVTSVASGGNIKPDFSGLQSLLTKSIGVAGGAAIAKFVLPKITQFFQKTKSSDTPDNNKEQSPIITPPPKEMSALPFGLDLPTEVKQGKSPIITPPPIERLALPPALQDLQLPNLQQLLLPAAKDTASKQSFPEMGRLPEIPKDLFREAQSSEKSVVEIGQNFLNILQNKLPQIVAGLLLAKLVTAIVGKLSGAKPDNSKGAIAGGVQSLLTKGLLASGGVAIAKLALPKISGMFGGKANPKDSEELLRAPAKPNIGNEKINLPKVTAALVAGFLAKNLLTGFAKEMFAGQQKDGSSKEGKKTKSGASQNISETLPKKDQGLLGMLSGMLLQKLPMIISGAIVALLIAKFAPLILSAMKPVDLSKTNEVVNKSTNIQNDAENLNNTQIQSVDTEKLQAVFNTVFDDIARVTGLDPSKIDKNKLRPEVKIDEQNRLKGASSYRGSSNQILLSNRVAQGLVSSEVPKEVFVELAHEIRHAIQAGFGTNLQGRAAQISKGTLNVAQGVEIPLLKLENLIDPNKTGQVKTQVNASTNAISGALPNQKEFVQSLELDAEVFAQNFADLIYGIKPDEVNLDDLFRINEDFVATLNQGLSGIEDALSNQGKKGQTAVDLVQSQKEKIVTPQKKEQVVAIQKPVANLTTPLANLGQQNQNNQQKPIAKLELATNKSTEKLNIKTILTGIQSQIQDLISVAKMVAQKMVAGLEQTITLDEQDLIPDSLLRAAPSKGNDLQGEKDQRLFGEKIGDSLNKGIDMLVDKVVDSAQKAGMSDGDIQEMGNQVGAFSFSMLSSFAPGGAIGLLVAPIAASLSALGIPIAAAVNQLTPLAQMLVDTMQTLTPIQTRFTTIGGGEQEGQQMFDFAANTANDLNVPMLSAIEGYSRLAAASQGTRLEGQDTEELFLGITKAIAALGLSAQDSSLIFLAFQQILSKGVVTAEELRGQISERLPGALQIFADALGLTLPELSKALENGELNLTKLAKLGPAFQKEFAEGAEKSSKSFIGALNKIENKILQLKISFVEQFGGIVGGIANVIAGAIGLIASFIDNVVLKTGLLFNAILGIQAYAVAGVFTLFSQFKITQNLMGVITGAYARLFPILLPFFFGTFVELISSAFGRAFNVQIDSAVTLITGLFSNVIGRVIQQVIDLGRSPKDALEGLINIIRNIALTFFDIADGAKYLRDKLSENFGFIGKTIEGVLGKAEGLGKIINRNAVNRLADNAIANVFKPAAPKSDVAPKEINDGGIDFKKIAQSGFEFFGLYIILIQTLQLVKIIGVQFGITSASLGGFFKALVGIGPQAVKFGKGLFAAGLSLSTFKGLLNVVTAGLVNSSLVLGGLVTLVALIAAKSDTVNSFLSSTSNSIKELQKLNTSIDGLTGKKVELNVETTYTEKGMRDTPFQDKGLSLTFWRDRSLDQFTTDDLIRQAQRLVDNDSFRRNLPLIPNTPRQGNNDPTNTGNIDGLQSVLTSQVAQGASLENFQQVVDLRQELLKEKKRVEDELVIELDLNTRNLTEEINRLKAEISSLNSFNLNPLVARFSIDGGASIKNATRERRDQLQAQIAELEKQREINQGSLVIEGSSVDIDTERMEKELEAINKQLSQINDEQRIAPITPLPSTDNPFLDQQRANIMAGSLGNTPSELKRQRDEILRDLSLIRQAASLSREDVQAQLNTLREQRDDIQSRLFRGNINPSERTGLNQESVAINRQIEVLVKFERQKEIDTAQEELARINRDLKAFEIFADNPSVFNNAFSQNDSLIKKAAIEQIGLFPSVADQLINPERLIQGNAVTEIPKIRNDIEFKLSRNNRSIADLNEAIKRIDRTSPNATEALSKLQQQINLLQTKNKSLTSLDLLLSTTESYARLGLGKAAIDANLLAQSLQSLADQLQNARIQTRESAGFIAEPSLGRMASLEQELLMQFGQQNTSLRQARSERANIEATPELSITERDLGRFGYLSKEARADLSDLNYAITVTKDNLRSLQDALNERMDDGIKSTVSFDEWNVANQEIEKLRSQLQELIKQRDAILQDAAKLAPPIQVDPTFREQRIQAVDKQIADIENRLNDLNAQYQAIQGTKLEISGATAIATQLDGAIRELNLQRSKFLGFLPNLRYDRRVDNLSKIKSRLEPALGQVNTFVGQQTQLDPVSLQGLLGGLQSADITTTQKTLEQLDIQGNRVFFNGQELEGTPEEIRSFIKAIRDASKALKDIQNIANSPFKGLRTKKALETNLGLVTGNEQRNNLLGEYRDTANRLLMSGALNPTQFEYLTAPGRNLADVETALKNIANQDGQTNFGAIVENLAKQGVPEEERIRVIEDLTKILDLVEELKGTDPAKSLIPSFGTVGEEEYNQTVARIGEIDKLAFDAFNKLSLASFTGDLKKFEQDLRQTNPTLLDNIGRLRQIQNELDTIGLERLKIQDQLSRNNLTIEERNRLEKESARLDEEFRSGYRRKKEIGGEIGGTFQQAQSAGLEVDKLVEQIQGSELDDRLKKQLIGNIENTQRAYLNPLLEFFQDVEDLTVLSADDRMTLAFKNISRSLKNLQESSARIQDETNKILAASSLKFREISTNLQTTPLTNLGVSGAGTNQDSAIFDARVELEAAITDENSRKQIRDIAFQEFTRSQKEFEIARASAANSPVVQQEELAPKREELTQITEQYTEAEQAYAQALTASSQARIALLEAETNAITRRNQLSTLLEQTLLKEKRLRGEVTDETFDTQGAAAEFKSVSVELASAEALFKAITDDVQKGLVPSVIEANRKLEELNIRIAELKNQKLDSQLELENAIRARANQLIDNQINLTSKYLDVAIAGYERLNGISGNTLKQLDGLTSLGQAVQSLFSSTNQRLQTSLGQQSNLLEQIIQGREALKSEDITPEERKKTQERQGDLRKLGQLQGVNVSPNASEAQILAKQAEIEAKLAQAKIDALKKEQAIANALLKIEIQRNRIAAEQAVKEAEINKLKQEQSVFQAQANLQKAAIEAARTGDTTGLVMAQLDLQIAQSQLSTAAEGIDIAKQNVLIQDAIAGLQLEQAGIDNANARDSLVGELGSNENLDLGKILNNINSLLNFSPSDSSSREILSSFLPKPKQETVIPEITVSLEEFNGDVNAWMNANIEANKARRQQAEQKNPEASAIQQTIFDVFGRPREANTSYRSGNVGGSLEEQFAALSNQNLGSRWGRLLAPTQEQILRFPAESMIQSGLDNGLIPLNFDPQSLGLDPNTLLPVLPNDLTNIPVPTVGDLQSPESKPLTPEDVTALSLQTTNKTLDNIYGIVSKIPDTFVQATEQLGQMLIKDEFKSIKILDNSSSLGVTNEAPANFLGNSIQDSGLFKPVLNTNNNLGFKEFADFKGVPFGQQAFTSAKEFSNSSLDRFSNIPVPQAFSAETIPYIANSSYITNNATTSMLRPDLSGLMPSPVPSVNPASTLNQSSLSKPKDTESVKYISPTVVSPTVRPARVIAPDKLTSSLSDIPKLPDIPKPDVNLQNVVNPNIQVPRQERTPFYFYRDIASEMSPQVDYTVPPGVQSLGQKHNYQPETKVQNISVNITNKIDANTQKDFFSKIAKVQQESIIQAINNA